MSTVDSQAQAAASRIDVDEVQLDFLTIIEEIKQAITELIKCWTKNDQPNPAKVKPSIVAANRSHQAQLLRRATHKVRTSSKAKLTRKQAEIIAQAIIDQALEADEPSVVACCREAGE